MIIRIIFKILSYLLLEITFIKNCFNFLNLQNFFRTDIYIYKYKQCINKSMIQELKITKRVSK